MRTKYIQEGLIQLTDPKFYTQKELNTTDTRKNTINEFLTTMYQNSEIDFSVYDYLLNTECRRPILYLLPQIHKRKTPPPGRPSISAVGSHTEKMLQFVDNFLNPCAQRVIS